MAVLGSNKYSITMPFELETGVVVFLRNTKLSRQSQVQVTLHFILSNFSPPPYNQVDKEGIATQIWKTDARMPNARTERQIFWWKEQNVVVVRESRGTVLMLNAEDGESVNIWFPPSDEHVENLIIAGGNLYLKMVVNYTKRI